MDNVKLEVFKNAITAMARFKEAFNRDLEPDVVAEIYAAEHLGLDINAVSNEPGFDAVDRQGRRYQVKYRAPGTLNIDINNFDFDYIVLVNVDQQFLLQGMWMATDVQAQQIFAQRVKFRKYQATQQAFKSIAKSII